MSETMKSIRVLGFWSFLYLRFAYRVHARLAHRLGFHTWQHMGPLLPSGDEFDRCTWCGAMQNFKEGNWPEPDPNAVPQAADARAERAMMKA